MFIRGLPNIPANLRSVPAEFLYPMIMEQCHNMRGRERPPLKVSEQGVQTLPYFVVPQDQVAVFQAVHISQEIEAGCFSANGKVRCYVDPLDICSRSKHLFEIESKDPRRTVSAARTASKRTWFVFEGDNQPFYLKLDGEWHRWVDSFSHVDLTKDVVSECVKKTVWLQRKDRQTSFAYLAEPLGTYFELPGLDYGCSQIFRPVNAQAYPLHGLLDPSNQVVNFFASLSFCSAQEWTTTLIQHMADFYADAFFEVGAHPTAHSQNLLIEINSETGQIGRIVYRDFQDLIIDPYFGLLFSQGKVDTLPRLSQSSYVQTIGSQFATIEKKQEPIDRFLSFFDGQVLGYGLESLGSLVAGTWSRYNIFRQAFLERTDQIASCMLTRLGADNALAQQIGNSWEEFLHQKTKALMATMSPVEWSAYGVGRDAQVFCSFAKWGQVSPGELQIARALSENSGVRDSYQCFRMGKMVLVVEKETQKPFVLTF